MDFIDETTPRERVLDGYRAILLPFCPNVDEATAGLFSQFVDRGGLLIADFPLGFKDGNGVLWTRSPGAGLDRVFGCRAVDALPASGEDADIALRLADGAEVRLRPDSFLQELTVDAPADVIGRCGGRAAVVSHGHGKGRAVLFSTMFFAAYDDGRGDAGTRRTVLRSLCAAHGVAPRFSVSVRPGGPAVTLEVCPLVRGDKEGDALCIVANHGRETAPFSLLVRGRVGGAVDVRTGSALAVAAAAEGAEIRGILEGKSTTVVALQWKP